MWRRGGDGGTGSYLTSAFLNSPFSLQGMLSSIFDKFETEINLQYCVCLAGMHLKNLPCLVFLLYMFVFTYYTVMQGIMGKAGTRSTPKLTAGGLKQNPLKKNTHTFSLQHLCQGRKEMLNSPEICLNFCICCTRPAEFSQCEHGKKRNIEMSRRDIKTGRPKQK